MQHENTLHTIHFHPYYNSKQFCAPSTSPSYNSKHLCAPSTSSSYNSVHKRKNKRTIGVQLCVGPICSIFSTEGPHMFNLLTKNISKLVIVRVIFKSNSSSIRLKALQLRGNCNPHFKTSRLEMGWWCKTGHFVKPFLHFAKLQKLD